MQLIQHRRLVTFAVAGICIGSIVVGAVHVYLTPASGSEMRACTLSDNFDGLSFQESIRKYHWTLEALIEERMNMYEGTTQLHCEKEKIEDILAPGVFASRIAEALPYVPDPPNFTYDDFELLLTEWYRMYDCHLSAILDHPKRTLRATGDLPSPSSASSSPTSSSSASAGSEEIALTEIDGSPVPIQQERDIARLAFDRILYVLRSSEQFLPLHVSLRCLQKGGEDVRNAVALLGDVSQCLPTRLSNPETSLLKHSP